MYKCNKSLIHTLFFNLINNAIKYNKVNEEIFINGFMKDNVFYLSIKDNGIGMTKEQQELIFNRFEKFNTTDNESYGLGLAIVKSITQFHNISISIESTQGVGTNVKLIFQSN